MIMKKIVTILLLIVFSLVQAQKQESFQLSSHILDISTGSPAVAVDIILEKYDTDNKIWHEIAENTSDKNGRVTNFLPNSEKSNKGIYRLRFLVDDYFKKQNRDSFYPFIEVVFQIKDDKHYHVPITLSSYGYSTYRGN